MKMQVIKRDGSTEEFNSEKLKNSILTTCQSVGLDGNPFAQQIVDVVVNGTTGKESVSFSEIRDAVLVELLKSAPTAVDAWKKHEVEVKKLTV